MTVSGKTASVGSRIADGGHPFRSLPMAALIRRAPVEQADLLALVLILLVGGALRLVFFPRAPVFIGGDTSQYYVPAAALLNGEGFPLPLKRPPLYPLFMAVIGWGLGPDLRVLVAVQHVLGVGVAALAYGIGRLAFGRLVGLLSGLATVLSGGLLIYEHYVLTEALFTFLLALAVFLSMLALRRDAVGWYVVSGLAIGLATLTRPHALVLLLLGPLVALHYHRRAGPALRAAVVASATAGLLLVPWMARNLAVHGAFTLVGAAGQNLIFKTANLHHGEFLFYDAGNRPREDDPRRLQAARLIQRKADEKAAKPNVNVSNRELHAQIMKDLKVSEAEADGLMRDVALDAIRARPLVYARAVFDDLGQIFVGVPDRLSYHWNLRERVSGPRGLGLNDLAGPVTPEQRRGMATTEQLVNLYQSARLGLLLPALFVLGLIASLVQATWRPALLPGLAVLSLHGAGAAVVGFVARFHHPPDPLLHVVAIGGLVFLVRLLQSAIGRARALGGGSALRVPAEPAR